MTLDQTRTKAFWSNPEAYRIQFQLDIVPAAKSYYLDRGTAFHTYIDLHSKGLSISEIDSILSGSSLYQGQTFEVAEKPRSQGITMGQAFVSKNQLGEYKVLESELEFRAPISGSPHEAVGRLDQVIEIDGETWLLEFKTANAKASLSKKETEWESDIQADFEMLGAAHCGYVVEGVLVQYVIESTPIKVWAPIPVKRTLAQLARTQLMIHQTAETIEMYKATFGIDQPWPHLSNWKCQGEWCEYKGICQQEGLSVEACGKGWKKREEHLEILQVAA